MKQRLSPNGFAASVILLLLVVILAVGGIGAYVYTGQHAKKPALNAPAAGSAPAASSTSPNGVPAGASGPLPPAKPANGDVTITVAEAGFQITVPASLKDLTYHVNNGVVSFSTASLTAAVPQCAATVGTGAFDTITRGSGSYRPPTNATNGGLLKQYDSYYLAYTLPTGPCAKGLSVPAQNLLDEQAQTFYGTLSTVK